ncbi:hypothetical protein GOP47_0013796 [Adiantum capillus-veneris]|uniref:Uncharacterized protein n=1 Tax=Adiantum capillus-veneris TaxID=13818 RepID=A0A9D4ZFQ2_ADICA|nr:hypothetical protein GOP47_0013796 [Adiantum capillus-veneris]
MGGGTVFRGVTRLVGAATVGAAVAPTQSALCHVRPPASNSLREQESLSVILDDAQKEFCDVNPNEKNFKQFANVRFEQEESTAEKGEGCNGAALRQLVFYPPPTEEEVEEATKELHAALNFSIPAQGFVVEEDPSDSMVGLTTNAEDMDITSPSVQNRGLAPSSSSGNFTVENNPVIQAFQLLQSNPKVQEVVKSLARDPAVWNAMLSNEKVLELTQENSHDSQDSFGFDDDEDEDEDDDDFLEIKELACLDPWKRRFSQRKVQVQRTRQ